MELEIIMLSEVRQVQKDKCHFIDRHLLSKDPPTSFMVIFREAPLNREGN
jgi:hypothetical protein